jgi:glutamine amidotransferase
MCRMLGYLGDAVPLATLIDAPPHSLTRQSWAARELDGATVSADGWGASWYLDGQSDPCVYRSVTPIWADVNREALGRTVRSSCLLAAVRSATDPLSVSHANTQPFFFGKLSFLHNGYIERFAPSLLRRLRAELSDEQYCRVQGNTDSEHLFAVLADAYARETMRGGNERLLFAVRTAINHTRELARDARVKALLTLIVTDGSVLIAARYGVGAEPPTLYVRAGSSSIAPGSIIASEPLAEESEWRSITPGTALVVASGEALREVELT